MKIAKIWLPLVGNWPVVVRPNSDNALMRLTFAQADARIHMWGDSAADMLETSTRDLSSSVRNSEYLAADWMERARQGYPEAL